MNYKKIIKSRNLRLFIIKFFDFIPDRLMIKIQYYIKTGRKLDLKRPLRYTEKLQWYKLNVRTNLMKQCVNKLMVRNYVESLGLEEILVPLYKVYDSADEINMDELPNSFVIKDTLGGGGNSVFIVKNKNDVDLKELQIMCSTWLKSYKKKSPGREWPYDSQKNQLIIEQLIETNEDVLDDFKFFCFNGKVEYIYIITDRKLGKKVKLGIFDNQLNKLEAYRVDELPLKTDYEKPLNFEKMIEISEKLSQPFLHARIDLYNVDGKIYFGEITFFDGSGYMTFEPDKFDFEMGNKFKIGS